MKRWVWMVMALGAACASNNQHLEDKVDNLAAQIARMQHQLEVLQGQAAKPAPAADHAAMELLAQKLDAISVAIAALPKPAKPSRAEPDRSKVYAVPADGFPAQGPADAKVTLIAARDYACPFCEKSRATLAALRQKYGPDLRIVYRNFIVHPQVASVAAFAACAAARQGQFEAFDDALWEQGFKTRSFDTSTATAPCSTGMDACHVVDGIARQLNLKIDQYRLDIASCKADVLADVAELQKFGVGATPSFFINGRFTSGAMPIESFSALIDEELARANERIKAGTRKATYYKTWVIGKGEPKL